MQGLQIEPGVAVDTFRGHGMKVAFAQHHVVDTLDLDLIAILRVEQHLVTHLGGPDVLAERHDLGPYEPLGQLRRRRDQDPARRAPLRIVVRYPHQQPVVEHLDRQLVVGRHEAHGTVPAVGFETVEISSSHGVRLAADLIGPRDATVGAVIAHPHPLYGGDRQNSVVTAIWEALGAAGLRAARFDFRGTGGSSGRHDHGEAEREDLVAVTESLRAEMPSRKVWLVGYSFGAMVVAATEITEIAGRILVAAPLGLGLTPLGDERLAVASEDHPTLVITPRHDQFCSPATVDEHIESWSMTRHVIVESADHFLLGATGIVAGLVLEAITPGADVKGS